jgi:hypothetical protein
MPTVSGGLVIAGAGPPLALAVSEATQALTGFEQKQATIKATAWLGPVARVCAWLSIGGCPDQHFGSPSVTVAGRGVVAHDTLIGSASGQNAVVSIASVPASPTVTTANPTTATTAAPPLARITASQIPGPGAYSGDVATDVSDTAPKTVTVTVHAQDALYWAVLVLALGSLVGALLTKFYDPWRAMRLLRASFQDAVKPYLDFRAGHDRRRPDRDYLDDLLVKADGGLAPAARQFPRRKWGGARPSEAVPALYWDTFGRKDADARADLSAAVMAMATRFARWKQLEDAFTALERALAKQDRQLLVRQDGESILDLAQGEPVDDAETRARVQAMAAFAVIAELYADVKARFDDAVRKLGNDWKARHASLDPANIYAAAHPLATRTPEQAAALRLDFLRARRLLVDAARVPADTGAQSVSVNLREGVRVLDASDRAGAAVQDLAYPASLITALVAPFVRYESAAEIRRSVRDWDWLVFGLLALFTALAYTLSFYVGKDWGSWTDYVAAFVAGATVPTVINWALFPSARAAGLAKASS